MSVCGQVVCREGIGAGRLWLKVTVMCGNEVGCSAEGADGVALNGKGFWDCSDV